MCHAPPPRNNATTATPEPTATSEVQPGCPRWRLWGASTRERDRRWNDRARGPLERNTSTGARLRHTRSDRDEAIRQPANFHLPLGPRLVAFTIVGRRWDCFSPRKTSWSEFIETRCIISQLMEHDLYHAGEINPIRRLRKGNDRWR